MTNSPFNKKKKRQIILENFNNRTHEVSLARLQEISNSLISPYHTFSGLNKNCGDNVHLLIQQENNFVKLALFATIENIEKMLQGQEYQLNDCLQMEVFQDLPQFPHRIECVNLVLRGVKSALGALAGAGLGGESGAISGALIFMLIGAIASVTFLALWIYHLVK
ncbi:7809_t:CDS:2 [Entrophospora sp. SA101]|nr:11915_t:CDS:2 [Entrophospora sp. SA101]CAJ0642303.1 14594_t:CDS:2 [Entrophospora sp. SA101]CAJ0761312.1 7809_t:CDS:2 [Entrophospora sp. SA101]CAJ0830259.1 1801_t:CDS:2 [Entrophospora sp. SA101]CAJ0845771.1 4330_t:CDS:2 [Entrophospora sp. SA101]